MSAPPPPPRHIASRELLERIRRDVLVRLLDPHRLFLEAKGLSLDALALTTQDDHSLIHPLFDLLNSGDPLLPARLVDALPRIEAVACESGHERLRLLDADRKLPQGRHGHETLTAIAFLDHPDLLAGAKMTAKSDVTGYTEYVARWNKPLPRDRERYAALGRALGAFLAARGRPPYCEPLTTETPRETVIDFVLGRVPATSERLTETLARTTAVDVLTQRVRAFFQKGSGNLGVQGHEFVREAIRRLAGEHLMDDADHFERADLYSLEALETAMDDALAAEESLGAGAIELREIWIRRADGVMTKHSHDADLRRSTAGADIASALAAGGRIAHVKLVTQLAFRKRPIRVEVTPPRKLDMARGDDDAVDAIRALLAKKGIMRSPAHARREAAVAQREPGELASAP